MPTIDILGVVHGSGASGGPLTVASGVYGDALCASGTQFSNLELDFGAPLAGTSYPYITQFPGLTERAYTTPPEVVGVGGIDYGLHLIVGQSFATITSILFNVCSAATTAATTIIAARSLTLAQLAAGQYYFIPVSPAAVLEFLRFQAVLTGSNATAGTIVAWFGPSQGGAL